MRAMSRFEPGLFSISRNPIVRTLTGLSAVRRTGEGMTVTISIPCASFSSSISMNGVPAETMYSEVSALR